MSTPTERMKVCIKYLPSKDINLGYRFLEDRDFESLKDLVDSAIYKVRKNQKNENPKEEYLSLDLGNLSTLKSEVDTYIALLEIANNEESYEDLEDCETEEDYY